MLPLKVTLAVWTGLAAYGLARGRAVADVFDAGPLEGRVAGQGARL